MMSVRPRISSACCFLLVAVCLGFASSSLAEDKNGVSPNVISRPSGPGSLEGLGDAFQPMLNTGTAKYGVSFSLPAGVAGFTPSLSLSYESGHGFGLAGIGWSFGPPSIRRQVDEGLPRYVDATGGETPPDRLLGMNGEELVPLANGYYLAKIEGSFIRYERSGDGWTARTKGGVLLEFGVTEQSRLTDSAGSKVYRWYLEKQTDTHGNCIQYNYARPSEVDRQVYLSEIRYGPGGPPWEHTYSAQLTYEDRPDARTDYRSGFTIRTAKRLKQVDVKYDDQLIRRYVLGYDADPHWSLVTTVTQYGADGVSALPTTTFGYATFDLGDASAPISAAGHEIYSANAPPGLDGSLMDLLDINADGLPDLLATDGIHAAYLNRGVRSEVGGQPALLWDGPIDLSVVEPRTHDFYLDQESVHLADMTGDGIADLVVTETQPDWVEYFTNTGAGGWSVGTGMVLGDQGPPAPFGSQRAVVRTSDLDFDKRMDILRSEDGAYSIWLNMGGGEWSDRLETDGAWHGGNPINFDEPGVHLADMNGDRLNDVVKLTVDSVIYCPSLGYGHFGESIAIPLPDRYLDDAPGGPLHRAKLTDINGDGLSDLIVERAQGDDIWFWLNLGNNTLEQSRVITDLPFSPDAVTRWADVNGNGTTDLIIADSSVTESRITAVDLGVLVGGSDHFNALTSISNGYGRKNDIVYRSSTEYYLDAYEAGNPWSTSVPFPVPVVSRVLTSTGLDLDGYPDEGPSGDVYITDFVYRDGYYDPLEKQFRGFGFVKQIERGDERFGGTGAPTLVTRYAFHTGAPDTVDNDSDSQIDEYHEWNGREEEPLKGVELWRETTSEDSDYLTRDGQPAEDIQVFERAEATWEVRELCLSNGGALPALFGEGFRSADDYDRSARQAIRTKVRTSVIERLPQTGDPTCCDPDCKPECAPNCTSSHKYLETRTDVDALGRTLFEWNLGDTCNSRDDSYTSHEYANNLDKWIMGAVTKTTVREGGPDGPFVSEARNYFDGPPFVGLPLGQIGTRGVLHRSDALITGDPVPPITERSYIRGDPRVPMGTSVDTLRQKVDAFGNSIVTLDANAALADGEPDGNGHERRIEYDPVLHKFPVRETIVLGEGQQNLDIEASYDYRFSTPLSVTDFNGHATDFAYDTFGRLKKEILPGDDPAEPTHRYAYDLGSPISNITTTAHTREGDSPDVITSQYFDGLGRTLGTFEAGGPVMSGVTLFDPRGRPAKAFQPYFGQPTDGGGNWQLPPPESPAVSSIYDATGRVIEVISPPDADGETAHATTTHLPLKTVQYDGEDNRIGGPHYSTPKTLISDGLGRLIEVHEIETLSAADSGTFMTQYRYTLPELLAEIEDASSNIKYMRYDGLGRRIFMNDCNRGHTTDTYDAAGNEIRTVDAKGQAIVYTYDGANRLLTEDYLDEGTPLSAERSPDVAYHYDTPSDDYPWLRNVRGQLSWVEDITGAEFRSFDMRGNPETTIKRIEQIDGGFQDWSTVTYADRLGRIYQIIYPDGSVVRQTYDARGLLHTIPGFLTEIAYTPAGQRHTWLFGNGVTTTYTYDPRLRLRHLFTESPAAVLQDLTYSFDQADNIIAIDDARALPPADPRTQTASFVIDNCYRLIQATGEGYADGQQGTIEYDYDRLGNMVKKVSLDIQSDDVNIGNMSSGGATGTIGRVGKSPGDSPGPHALTFTDNGTLTREFAYDDNGNMILNDGDGYTFDFKGRLGKVVKDGRDIRYLYDYTDRRVIKRVDGAQATYINSLCELRDGQPLKYVFADGTRVATVDGKIPPPPEVTQRVPLSYGWNLFSFQVDPGTTDPATILAPLAGKYLAIYGTDDSSYPRFSPNGDDSELTSLYPNCGYWILMHEPAEFQMTGLYPCQWPSFTEGQPRLVGIPELGSKTSSSLYLQYPFIATIWSQEQLIAQWLVYTPHTPFLNSLQRIQSTRAYWIETREDAFLVEEPGPPANKTFYHTDHTGSISLIVDSQGLTNELRYFPFGAPRYERIESDGQISVYGFAGQELDSESALTYFRARYYTSHIARLVTVDPVYVNPRSLPVDRRSLAMRNPQRWHTYCYGINKPMEFGDPTGLDPTELEIRSLSEFSIDEIETGVDAMTEVMDTCGQIRGALYTAGDILGASEWDRTYRFLQGMRSMLYEERARRHLSGEYATGQGHYLVEPSSTVSAISETESREARRRRPPVERDILYERRILAEGALSSLFASAAYGYGTGIIRVSHEEAFAHAEIWHDVGRALEPVGPWQIRVPPRPTTTLSRGERSQQLSEQRQIQRQHGQRFQNTRRR